MVLVVYDGQHFVQSPFLHHQLKSLLTAANDTEADIKQILVCVYVFCVCLKTYNFGIVWLHKT